MKKDAPLPLIVVGFFSAILLILAVLFSTPTTASGTSSNTALHNTASPDRALSHSKFEQEIDPLPMLMPIVVSNSSSAVPTDTVTETATETATPTTTATATPAAAATNTPAATLTATATATVAASNYAQNLALIRGASVRNTNHDESDYSGTPMDELVLTDHYGPRSDYLDNPAGNPESSFPVEEGGQFRTSCEFSHFAYDDPLVYPNQPGAAHLHMFWGNTDVNAYSTYDTLFNSGSSTCNGQELNRTGYWAPAMFDAEGNVRIPERVVIYYKGYGLAIENAEVYPPEAAMIASRNVHQVSWNEGGVADPDGGESFDSSFLCADQWRGSRDQYSETIPVCDGDLHNGLPRTILEMHVKFPNCWNGEDASDPANWDLAEAGGWFYSFCDERATFPNIEYLIMYPVEEGETTEGWYLSSDVDPMTLTRTAAAGTSTHADWWGGWHLEINEVWVEECATFKTDVPSGCGMGYLSDGGPDEDNPYDGPALKFRPQYEGPLKVPAATLFEELCAADRVIDAPEEAAYCSPMGHNHGH